MVVGSPDRLRRVASFIVEHWEKRREAMEGKCLVMTMSRSIAVRLYDEIKVLRPQWHSDDDNAGFMKVVMASAPYDPLEFNPMCVPWPGVDCWLSDLRIQPMISGLLSCATCG
jgi:type I restriction enzyme, R subunit